MIVSKVFYVENFWFFKRFKKAALYFFGSGRNGEKRDKIQELILQCFELHSSHIKIGWKIEWTWQWKLGLDYGSSKWEELSLFTKLQYFTQE